MPALTGPNTTIASTPCSPVCTCAAPAICSTNIRTNFPVPITTHRTRARANLGPKFIRADEPVSMLDVSVVPAFSI